MTDSWRLTIPAIANRRRQSSDGPIALARARTRRTQHLGFATSDSLEPDTRLEVWLSPDPARSPRSLVGEHLPGHTLGQHESRGYVRALQLEPHLWRCALKMRHREGACLVVRSRQVYVPRVGAVPVCFRSAAIRGRRVKRSSGMNRPAERSRAHSPRRLAASTSHVGLSPRVELEARSRTRRGGGRGSCSCLSTGTAGRAVAVLSTGSVEPGRAASTTLTAELSPRPHEPARALDTDASLPSPAAGVSA